mmetsp:Transcript_57934/g.188401  ORF Transcript_57934/g.188401 Transcript_57934/m.188401 type:complete len:952 (-) Transcript_57934:58-2913(-)
MDPLQRIEQEVLGQFDRLCSAKTHMAEELAAQSRLTGLSATMDTAPLCSDCVSFGTSRICRDDGGDCRTFGTSRLRRDDSAAGESCASREAGGGSADGMSRGLGRDDDAMRGLVTQRVVPDEASADTGGVPDWTSRPTMLVPGSAASFRERLSITSTMSSAASSGVVGSTAAASQHAEAAAGRSSIGEQSTSASVALPRSQRPTLPPPLRAPQGATSTAVASMSSGGGGGYTSGTTAVNTSEDALKWKLDECQALLARTEARVLERDMRLATLRAGAEVQSREGARLAASEELAAALRSELQERNRRIAELESALADAPAATSKVQPSPKLAAQQLEMLLTKTCECADMLKRLTVKEGGHSQRSDGDGSSTTSNGDEFRTPPPLRDIHEVAAGMLASADPASALSAGALGVASGSTSVRSTPMSGRTASPACQWNAQVTARVVMPPSDIGVVVATGRTTVTQEELSKPHPEHLASCLRKRLEELDYQLSAGSRQCQGGTSPASRVTTAEPPATVVPVEAVSGAHRSTPIFAPPCRVPPASAVSRLTCEQETGVSAQHVVARSESQPQVLGCTGGGGCLVSALVEGVARGHAWSGGSPGDHQLQGSPGDHHQQQWQGQRVVAVGASPTTTAAAAAEVAPLVSPGWPRRDESPASITAPRRGLPAGARTPPPAVVADAMAPRRVVPMGACTPPMGSVPIRQAQPAQVPISARLVLTPRQPQPWEALPPQPGSGVRRSGSTGSITPSAPVLGRAQGGMPPPAGTLPRGSVALPQHLAVSPGGVPPGVVGSARIPAPAAMQVPAPPLAVAQQAPARPLQGNVISRTQSEPQLRPGSRPTHAPGPGVPAGLLNGVPGVGPTAGLLTVQGPQGGFVFTPTPPSYEDRLFRRGRIPPAATPPYPAPPEIRRRVADAKATVRAASATALVAPSRVSSLFDRGSARGPLANEPLPDMVKL